MPAKAPIKQKRLRQLYAQGLNTMQIGYRFEITRQAVSKMLDQKGTVGLQKQHVERRKLNKKLAASRDDHPLIRERVQPLYGLGLGTEFLVKLLGLPRQVVTEMVEGDAELERLHVARVELDRKLIAGEPVTEADFSVDCSDTPPDDRGEAKVQPDDPEPEPEPEPQPGAGWVEQLTSAAVAQGIAAARVTDVARAAEGALTPQARAAGGYFALAEFGAAGEPAPSKTPQAAAEEAPAAAAPANPQPPPRKPAAESATTARPETQPPPGATGPETAESATTARPETQPPDAAESAARSKVAVAAPAKSATTARPAPQPEPATRKAEPTSSQQRSPLQEWAAEMAAKSAVAAAAVQLAVKHVGAAYGYHPGQFTGKETAPQFEEARQVAMFVALRVTGLSSLQLARPFECTPSTIDHANSEISIFFTVVEPLREKILRAEAEIRGEASFKRGETFVSRAQP